ncbi:MAG: hypothetical protein R2798_13030 [Chitinophagales bacterium]
MGNYLEALRRDDAKGQEIYAFAMHAANQRMDTLKKDAKQIIAQALPQAELNDKDYVFISFILKYFPTDSSACCWQYFCVPLCRPRLRNSMHLRLLPC